MSNISLNLLDIYSTYFQKPYYVENPYPGESAITDINLINGVKIKELIDGVEVFLPVTFSNIKHTITIPCATIRVTNKKTIIRTAVSERAGTIKEQYQLGDYIFTIKGVLVGSYRRFPTDEITHLKALFESTDPVSLNNAYAEMFMVGHNNIAIESIEFPEQEGKHIRFRPFLIICETDFIDNLILK